MKNVLFAGFSAIGIACSAFAAAEADGVTLRDTYQPKAVAGSGTYEFQAVLNSPVTIGGASFNNDATKNYGVVASGGAVFKPSVPAGAQRADMYFGLIVTNGQVTLDLSGIDASVPFRFQCGLWVGGDGSFVVKGRDKLIFGRESGSGAGFGNVAASAVDGFRAEAVAFVDAEEKPYENPAGVEFAGWFCEIRMPRNVPWTIAEGANAIAYKTGAGAGGLYDRYVKDGVMTLDRFDLQLLDPAAFRDVRFVVGENRCLGILPRTLYFDNTSVFMCFSNSNRDFNNDVVLEGGTLYHGNHYATTHSGSISGTGSFVFAPPLRRSSDTAATKITGAATFSGPVEVSCGAANPAATLIFAQASAGAPGNAVTVGKGAQLRLEPVSTPASGRSASVSAVEGSSLYIGSGLTLQVDAAYDGALSVSGAGAEVSKLIAGAMPSCGYIVCGPQEAGFTLEAADNVKNATVAVSQGSKDYLVPVGKDGAADLSILGDVFDPLAGKVTLSARDGGIYRNVPSNVTVKAAAGVRASVVSEMWSAASIETEKGSSVAFERRRFDWEAESSLHFDFSSAVWTGYGPGADGGVERTVDGFNHPIVSNVFDVAGSAFVACDKSQYSSISPHMMTNALNGRSYLSFAHSTKLIRARFYNRQNASILRVSPKFAIVVFGSHNGGGAAIFGDAAGAAFLRGGLTLESSSGAKVKRADTGAEISGYNVTKDFGLFADDSIPCWLDGVKVAKPSTQPLSGGWQIISVDMTGKRVDGLGFVKDPGNPANNNGGQNYAEIVFFDRVLDEAERTCVERHLAEKWGIESYNDSGIGASVPLSLAGYGCLSLKENTVLEAGSFSGTIDLNGKKLTVPAGVHPPVLADILAAKVQPQNWFDPEQTGSLYMDGKTSHILRIYDWRDEDQTLEGIRYLSSASRSGVLQRSSKGGSPERNWIDYSPVSADSASATAVGRGYRFRELGKDADNMYAAHPVAARTVIMAQDSSKNGGTPFMDTVSGSQLSQRSRVYDTYGATRHGDPIWRDNSVAVFADGLTCIDGRAVDGSRAGFGGCPEVLTAVGAEDFQLGAFGNLNYLNGHTLNNIDEGEIHGEILVYGQVLPDEERRTVEAYLAWKWCGKAINGYVSYTNLTLTGEGEVVVESVAQMPKFDDDFAGTVSLANISSLDFTLERGEAQVAGALSIPGRVVFAENVTVNVYGRPKAGEYTLVSAGGGLDQTAWTLAPTSGVNAELIVTSSSVRLNVKSSSLGIIVR